MGLFEDLNINDERTENINEEKFKEKLINGIEEHYVTIINKCIENLADENMKLFDDNGIKYETFNQYVLHVPLMPTKNEGDRILILRMLDEYKDFNRRLNVKVKTINQQIINIKSDS